MIKDQLGNTVTEIETLLPCPFYGNEVKMYTNGPTRFQDKCTYEVKCLTHADDCHYSGGYYKTREYDSVGKLIAQWNKRK